MLCTMKFHFNVEGRVVMSYNVGINGYKFFTFSRNGRKGIIIVYLKDNDFFSQSKYFDLTDDQIASIKDVLDDNISYNLNSSRDCEKIPLPTIIWNVEQIVYH